MELYNIHFKGINTTLINQKITVGTFRYRIGTK